MFCTFCKTARVANEAPCPNCGAPSPMIDNSQHVGWGAGTPGASSWGGPGAQSSMPSGGQWEQPQVPQMSFNASAAPWESNSNSMPPWQQSGAQYKSAWQQSEPLNPMPAWQQPSGQLGAQPAEQSPAFQQDQQQSMLPVPYQGGMELQPEGRQPTISLQLVPQHAVEHLLPAEPLNPDVVHVPPTFTKPRPIVPRHRVISGFLSVLIVGLLLCSGAGYYAKASGTWDKVVGFYNGKAVVSSINTDNTTIPDPPAPTDKDSGPAMNIIPSVSLATHVDQANLPIQSVNIFKPGQTFYLTFSVQPPKGPAGTVTAKWYTNNIFFRSQPVPKKFSYDPIQVYNTQMSMQFTSRLSGYVELYWNNQFAQRRYFAVK